MNDLPYRPNRISTAPRYHRPGYGSARDREGRSSYGDRHGLHRPPKLLRYDEEPYARVVSEYQRQSRQTSKCTFDQAATWLHEVLNSAVRFYENFHGEFEREVKGIRAYASHEIINAIWVAKIDSDCRGERRAQRVGQRSDQRSDNGYDDRERVPKQRSFRDVGSNLGNALRGVTEAVPRRDQQRTSSSDEIEMIKLVMEKLRMAYRNIDKLLGHTMKRPDKMRAVIKEIWSTLRVMEENSETWDSRGRRNREGRRYNVDDRMSGVEDEGESTPQGMDDVDDHNGQGDGWNDNEHADQWQ